MPRKEWEETRRERKRRSTAVSLVMREQHLIGGRRWGA